MKTLKELVEAAKCRKGAADGTTKRGAFWLACKPIEIRSYGGGGIGNEAADCRHTLHLRHYRSGDVQAMFHAHAWHQDGGRPDTWQSANELLACTTIEDVVVALKGVSIEVGYGFEEHAYSDWGYDNLATALKGLGMGECVPAPDEAL